VVLVLRHSDITRLLDRDEVRAAVERGLGALGRGDWQNPPPRAMALPEDGTAIPMAAAGGEFASVKLLCDLPGNRHRALPVQRSSIVVVSAVTGECVALLDGRAVTAIRTAATTAVATDLLARSCAPVLGLVGAGNLAIEHARAISAVRRIEQIVVWSRRPATVETFRAGVAELDIPVHTVASVAEVVATADVVCTLTPSREPLVRGAWLRPGQHVNAVGAPPRSDHREVDGEAMRRARIVVDDLGTAMAKSGGVLLALTDGAITEDDLRSELGHIVSGATPGRTSDTDITLFESVGMGLQDLATAELVIARARSLGVGVGVDLTA
jgi:alanine dehydrogenase